MKFVTVTIFILKKKRETILQEMLNMKNVLSLIFTERLNFNRIFFIRTHAWVEYESFRALPQYITSISKLLNPQAFRICQVDLFLGEIRKSDFCKNHFLILNLILI